MLTEWLLSLHVTLAVLAFLAVLAGVVSAGRAEPAASRPASAAAADAPRAVTVKQADETIVSAAISGPIAYLPGVMGGFESYYNPKLKKMRDEYNPGAAIEGVTDELEQIWRLRHWVHTRWPIDDNCPFPYDDPFDILEEAAKDPNMGFYCAHSQTVANAVFWAYGFTTRLVYLDVDYEKKPKGGHHAVNEVWSNTLCKWIAIDCKYDIHFERDGVPLSALEIHEAVRRDGGQGIKKCWGLERKDPTGDGKWHGNIGSYYWVGYWLRSDKLNQPHWYLNNDFTTRMVIWDTPATRSTRWPRNHDHDNIVWEADRHCIDWTPNIPKLFELSLIEPGTLKGRFLSATPNFKEYRLRQDGGQWRPMETARGVFRWTLHPGVNTLDCRTRNLWGNDGPVVTLHVEYNPAAQTQPAAGQP